jgi:hypothetical protein
VKCKPSKPSLLRLAGLLGIHARCGCTASASASSSSLSSSLSSTCIYLTATLSRSLAEDSRRCVTGEGRILAAQRLERGRVVPHKAADEAAAGEEEAEEEEAEEEAAVLSCHPLVEYFRMVIRLQVLTPTTKARREEKRRENSCIALHCIALGGMGA